MAIQPGWLFRGLLIGCAAVISLAMLTTTNLTLTARASAASQTALLQTDDNPIESQASHYDGCPLNPEFPKKVRRWCDLIVRAAEKHDLDPDLIAALIWQESGGNPEAYSRSGAVGLMQVMPRDGVAAEFLCKNGPCFANRPTTKQLKDPEFNLEYGTRMLSRLVKQRGGLREALKAYGPMDVGYSYADKVLNIYQRYKD